MITPTRYLFIDGAFLAGVCKSMADNVGISNSSVNIIDMRSIVSSYQRSFYYDCLPSQKNSEASEDFRKRIDEKEKEFRRFEIIPNLRVHSGLSRYRKT